ncbi:MAG: GntR family transcriptional regulator [Sphaerochaetaceae bacterium]
MTNTKLLYEIVYDTLKAKILSGGYCVGDLLPSERMISEQHNVDRTTVRKALKMLVDDDLVEKLPGIGTKVVRGSEKRVSDEGETETKASNSPKGTISFFLPPSVHRTDRISQPFYSTLFYHTEREARAKGYACFYSTLDEHDDFESMLKRQRFDGIIFVSNVSEKFIEMAKEFHIPCVLVNEYNPHILSYMVDNITGMMNLCEYLIDLGHRRFALIKGIESYLSCQERMIGCTYAFAKNNIAPPPSVSCDWEPDTAYQATKEFLLSAETLPTAMVGFNDNIAIGCLRAANELGLRVPQDISIVGFDDIEQSRYSIPALTTVHGSIQQLAISTIQGLLYQIQNSQTLTTLKTYIPVSLVIRDSAAPPPAHPVGSVRG